jgi:hypothetical protein
MKYLTAWTFELTKIPKYDEFKQPLIEPINYNLLEKIIELKESDYDHICPKTGEVTNVTWAILKDKLKSVTHTNRHTTRANQSCGLGRFQSNSFITMPKKIKHTLFSYAGMKDIDQEKGHPRIAYGLGLKNNKCYQSIKQYIDAPDDIFQQMGNHFGIDLNDADGKNKDRLKWFFNLTIYGGGYDNWIKGLTEPSKKDLSLGYKALELKRKDILPIMKSFQDDCKDLSQKIYVNNDQIREHLSKEHAEYDAKTEYEKQNCVMSYAMQIIENDALHKAYLYLKKNKLLQNNKEFSLEYDGLCFVPNREIVKTDIDELNKYVSKLTGFDIKYVVKPYKDCNIYNDVIEIVKQMKLDAEAESREQSYEYMKERFELEHSTIINSSFFAKKTKDQCIFFNRSNLMTSYEHWQTVETYTDNDGNEKTRKKQFINQWLKDPCKKVYEDIGIYPNKDKCPPTILNMWKDFDMESVDKYIPMIEERDFLLNHIRILCNHDDAVYQYFIRWIAQMIQYPDVKSICPILISEEGGGKGTLMELFQKMLGSNKVYETTTPSKNVWGGSSNSLMKSAFLVNLNEMSQKESYGAEGQIKALITDPTITIKELYSNPIVVNSFHRFIITSNGDEAVSKKAGDRRKFIIRCSDELCKAKFKNDEDKHNELSKYHDKSHKLLEDVNVIKTVYDYFKYEIEDMHDFKRLSMPETEHDLETQAINIDTISLWLEHYVYNDLYAYVCQKNDFAKCYEHYNFPANEMIVKKTASQLYHDFMEYVSLNSIKYDCNNVKFGVRLSRLNIDGVGESARSAKGNHRMMDIGKIGSHYGMDLTYMSKDDDE